MREFTQFGSGFHIAMRDLEIRGAGSLLGGQQHGHMESVGYDMYLRLLGEAVAEAKGEPIQKTAECTVDIQISAHIPESYMESLSQRLDMYRKIASVQNGEDEMDLLDELIDRYGEPPREVVGLITVSRLRNTAAQLGITEINQRGRRDAVLSGTSHAGDDRGTVAEVPGQSAVRQCGEVLSGRQAGGRTAAGTAPRRAGNTGKIREWYQIMQKKHENQTAILYGFRRNQRISL